MLSKCEIHSHFISFFQSICPHSPVTLSSSLTSNFLRADFSLLSRSLHVANFCGSKFSSPKRKCLSTALPQMNSHYDHLSSLKLDVISPQCILFAPLLWQCHILNCIIYIPVIILSPFSSNPHFITVS